MAHRTYTEKEVAALLERAAELQARAARRNEHRPGLTLSELESVAAEAGLDPVLLRQAATELDDPGGRLLDQSSGSTASHVFVERRLQGALTPEVWEDIVAELRHQFDTDLGMMVGMPGYGRSTTEQIGRTLEWKHTSVSGVETRVMIRPRGELLNLRLNQRVGWASPEAEGVIYGATIAASMAVILGLGSSSAWVGLGVLVALLVTCIPLIYVLDRAWRQKKHRELEALAERVAALVAVHQHPAAQTATPAAVPAAVPEAMPERRPPTVELPHAENTPPTSEGAPARTRRRQV